ncbi:hypothetical protein AB1N83_012543 [Pleurotus pulmonarius]
MSIPASSSQFAATSQGSLPSYVTPRLDSQNNPPLILSRTTNDHIQFEDYHYLFSSARGQLDKSTPSGFEDARTATTRSGDSGVVNSTTPVTHAIRRTQPMLVDLLSDRRTAEEHSDRLVA